jgi:hypothetical protein
VLAKQRQQQQTTGRHTQHKGSSTAQVIQSTGHSFENFVGLPTGARHFAGFIAAFVAPCLAAETLTVLRYIVDVQAAYLPELFDICVSQRSYREDQFDPRQALILTQTSC